MKKSEAAEHLRVMLYIFQKMRSNIELDFIRDDPIARKVAAELLPWVLSDECPIVHLVRVLDLYEVTGELDGNFFMNMLMIINRLQPQVSAQAILFKHEFPEWDKNYYFLEDG